MKQLHLGSYLFEKYTHKSISLPIFGNIESNVNKFGTIKHFVLKNVGVRKKGQKPLFSKKKLEQVGTQLHISPVIMQLHLGSYLFEKYTHKSISFSSFGLIESNVNKFRTIKHLLLKMLEYVKKVKNRYFPKKSWKEFRK